MRTGARHTVVVLAVLTVSLGLGTADFPVGAAAPPQICPTGIISYWHLDDGTGSTAADGVDANDGTLVGDPVWSAGLVGGALTLDDPGDYVLLSDSASLSPTTAITLEAWIKPADLVTDQHIFSTAGPGPSPLGHDYYIRLDGGGLDFRINDVGFGPSDAVTVANEWYHIAATYDQAEGRKVYVNGELLAEDGYSSPINTGHDSVTIGVNARNVAFGESFATFDGVIDEAAIYGRALTATEIQEHHLNGLGGDGYCSAVTCDTLDATIVGTAAADTLVGGPGDDVIVGLGGDDVIRGKGGNDTICAGGGDDIISGGLGIDVIFGNAGSDTASYAVAPAGVFVNLGTGQMVGGDGPDLLTSVESVIGSAFADELIGNARDNTLIGGKGDDLLRGKSGDDTLDGGPGDDTLEGRNGDDTLIGRSGNDTVIYPAAPASVIVDLGARTASGGHGTDVVRQVENVLGSVFDDLLRGSAVANVLRGGRGDDTIRGRKGNDELIGGKGIDFANGGSGTDRCKAETELFCEL